MPSIIIVYIYTTIMVFSNAMIMIELKHVYQKERVYELYLACLGNIV